MSQQEDFYIGYLNGQKLSKSLWVFVGAVLIIAPLLAVWLVSRQRGFADSTYEFGNLTQHEGIIVNDPIPMLLREDKSIPLIGYGKFGADALFEELPEPPFEAKVEGTLVYYDGRTLLEVTNGVKGIEVGEAVPLENDKMTAAQRRLIGREAKVLGPSWFGGEIIDPKCYFGAMTPGQGKPHRSCAIRCISGGIPPVFAVHNGGDVEYYLLRGKDGEPINQQILDLVALPVLLSGELLEYGDWKVLRCDPKNIERDPQRYAH